MLLLCSSGKLIRRLNTNVPTDATRFDPSLDSEVRTFSRNLLRKASETAAGRSKDGGVGQYANYAGKLILDKVARCGKPSMMLTIYIAADVEANDIFGPNVKRLEDLKHKYDPDNLFSHGTRLTPRPLVVVN
jgi:hypothetical protein